MYNAEINREWGTEVYPLILTPTMKELQLSKGTVWKNTVDKKGKVISDMADRLTRKTGIKPKGTHFKMDVGQRKVGLNELLVIHAKEDGLNDFTKRVELMAIPMKSVRNRK